MSCLKSLEEGSVKCVKEGGKGGRLMVRQERDKKVLLVQQEEKYENTEQAKGWKEEDGVLVEWGPKGVFY